MSVVTTVVTTGAVAFNGDALPGHRGDSGLDAAVRRGDSVEVTVHKVSEVDSFEGAEPATGLFFRARVAGLRQIAGCWLTESRAAAQDLLLGKNVRLVVRRGDGSGSDQIMVDVLLPDGADYARTIVHDGAAPADPDIREDLTPVESTAREERRGLWATGCPRGEATATASSAPSSSAPGVPATTTTLPATTESPSSSPPLPSSSATWSLMPPGDLWIDVMTGKRCSSEGERRTSITGKEMVCARDDKNELRWRREK